MVSRQLGLVEGCLDLKAVGTPALSIPLIELLLQGKSNFSALVNTPPANCRAFRLAGCL